MAFNIPGIPFRASSNVPDLMEAISKGFTVGMQPQKQAQELLASSLANKISQAKAQYAPQRQQSEIDHILAQIQQEKAMSQHFGAQTTGLNLTNASLPEKLRYELMQQRNKAEHPELGFTGNVGDLARLQYLQQNNPGVFGQQSQSQQDMTPQNFGQGHGVFAPQQEPQENLYDRMRNSILGNMGAQKNMSTLDKAQAGYDRAVAQYGANSEQAQTALSFRNKTAGTLNKDTTTVQSIKQQIALAIPRLREAIENLKAIPAPFAGSPDFAAKTAHEKAVIEAAESYVLAKGWKNTDENMAKAMKLLERGFLNSDKSYHSQLQDITNSIENDYENATGEKLPPRESLKRREFKDQKEFLDYLKHLTPGRRAEAKILYASK